MTPATGPATGRAAHDPWKEVSAARLPAGHLPALAPVRDRAEVRVHLAGGVAWVRWPAGQKDVVRCLLPVPGVAFFTRRDGLWSRFGSRLPTEECPPADDGRPVAAVLVPARVTPVAPEAGSWSPVVLRVVRGGEPKPAAALLCRVVELAKWADTATTAELAAVRAARCGDRAVLLGAKLPPIPSGTRFWGGDLLVPVGFRPDPELPPAALRAAAGATLEELVLLTEDGAELIPRVALEPLTRAGLRLALRDLGPGGAP
jgi:hypothetical protein